jgi:SAM-dependent methyltransferase
MYIKNSLFTLSKKLTLAISLPTAYANILWRSIGSGNRALLDVGCGRGNALFWLKCKGLPSNCFTVGVDLYLPYLKLCCKMYNGVILADARMLPFRKNSFDVVLCVELIEHLEKREGKELLISLENLARKLVIVTTPSGFLPQNEVRGINGLRLLRGPKGEIVFKGIVGALLHILSYMSQLFVWFVPAVAFSMICIKSLKYEK